MTGDRERHGVRLITNTLHWLLSDDCDVDALHPGLRHTLIASRTQIDAAEKLAAPPARKDL